MEGIPIITFKHKGDFGNTDSFLKKVLKGDYLKSLEQYAQEGVAALMAATPVDSGLTASSWTYEITRGVGSTVIAFNNTNIQNGVPIAIILQYGHGTRNGGWVQGRDYINPAIQPIFDRIAANAWKEVTES